MTSLKTLSENDYERLQALLYHNEGFVPLPYDDATGQHVRAPQGNLTWLVGFNLDVPADKGLANVIMLYKLQQMETELIESHRASGYQFLSGIQKIAIWDMIYQNGVPHVLDFSKMWTAIALKDYKTASSEMIDSDWARKYKIRSTIDANMMETGVWCGI